MKSFFLWKKLVRRNIFAQCSRELAQNLFVLDPTLRSLILQIRSQCLSLLSIQYLDAGCSTTLRYTEFIAKQNAHR